MKRMAWLLAGLLLSLPVAAQDRVEVLSLRYRSAAEVIPLIQPLVGPGGAVTGMQNKLIVRASPEQLARIRQVLASIDNAPHRLMITVRLDRQAGQTEEGADVSGRIGPGGEVAARVWSNRREDERMDEQRLQLLEGQRAFIRTGTAVPYRTQTVTRDPWGRVVVQESTTFRDVDTGFDVVPRLNGEEVLLEIHPRRSQLNADGSVTVEAVSSTVVGRLGEWIELGGSDVRGAGQGTGLVYGTRGDESARLRVRVRVERLP